MQLFYDLAASPPTHDFVNFLVRAEQLRLSEKQPSIELGIVKGYRRASPRDFFYSRGRRDWRIYNLLVPVARLLPSISEVNVLPEGSGKQALSYANHKEPTPPVLEASGIAKSIVGLYLRDKPNPVTISIRQSDFEPQRNSDMPQWARVIGWLIKNGYTPIVVDDAESEFVGKCKRFAVETYHPASYLPDLRLALYEASICNLMTTGGPMVMALASHAPVMAWKLLVPGIQCTTEAHMRNSAMTPDHDWGPYKKLSFQPDQAEIMIADLERHLPAMKQRMGEECAA